MTNKEIFNKAIGSTDKLAEAVRIISETTPYCLIGGLALNTYLEPVFTADADFVIQKENTKELVKKLKEAGFKTKINKFDIEVKFPASDLKIHLTFDEKYKDFPSKSKIRELFKEYKIKTACISDLIKGKLMACVDPQRKLEKQFKDMADIKRILNKYPELIKHVPEKMKKHFIREKIDFSEDK